MSLSRSVEGARAGLAEHGITWEKAVRVAAPIIIGLVGMTGVGKTYSAFLLAKALGSKVYVGNSEGKRGRRYADVFNYTIHEIEQYGSLHYRDVIVSANKAGADVTIIDSTSHEHEGEGGLLDYQAKEHQRMKGGDNTKFMSWIKPKAAHKEFVNAVVRCDSHLILCFRGREKMKMVKDRDGKSIPVPMGIQPIGSDDLFYECDVLLHLEKNEAGDEGYYRPAKKMLGLEKILRPGERITEELGRQLMAWNDGPGMVDMSGAGPELLHNNEFAALASAKDFNDMADPKMTEFRKRQLLLAAKSRGIIFDRDVGMFVEVAIK